MIIDDVNFLMHYGILRRSGRYPWGSGGNVQSRSRSLLQVVKDLQSQGMSEADIARGFDMTTTQLRALKSIAKNEVRAADISQAQRLKERGWSNVKIGQRMGINESSVRALLAPSQKDKVDVLETTSNMLKSKVDNEGFIDVGVGVERHLDISRNKLDTAIARLREEGYELHTVQTDQLGTGPGQKTLTKVLAPPGTTYRDIASQQDKIKTLTVYSQDGGRSYTDILPPLPVSSKRVQVRYAEDGGDKLDGVIYVRPGVKDLSLGGNTYAQVRIAIDGTHYLKGMAMYKDDLPHGVDLQFNTNKSSTGNKHDAMKPISDDPDLPFGAVLRRQITDVDANGNRRVTSAMNIINEDATWEKWSRTLSSQMLSKQSSALARQQLGMTYDRRKEQLDSIMALTNPTVRKKLLEEFAEGVDAAAVHLKAHALPRQSNKVILPISSLKETEIFAPTYRNGERVVLIRHPHGGIFEIPELTVNNRNPEGKRLLAGSENAVGINHKVAARLSGADFDGDTVIVIPNNSGQIKHKPALSGLKGFDPIRSYPKYPGMPEVSERTKQVQMGMVSNLITDMTIKGASDDELARAVRHSMVVIDSKKHQLNHKQSAIDNGIPQLMEKYQGRKTGGAATLISRSGVESTTRVPERKPRSAAKGGPVDRATGRKVFEETGASFVQRTVGKDGKTREKVIIKTTTVPKLAATDDAHSLVSAHGGTPMERIYADHSNKLKALANEARKAAVNTKHTPSSPSAKKAYANEVASLNSKLNIALRNAPRERDAQRIANAEVSQKRRANPDMEPSELKKVQNQALLKARIRTGAHKTRVDITDAEWEAIQAGAVSTSKLEEILKHADSKRVKELAQPKEKILMTPSKTSRARTMLAQGYTQAEVADALGVSLTTLKTAL